jgi:hypothetical protein
MALTQKINRKKSSESSVQPRKAAAKVRLWERVSRRKSFRTDINGRIAECVLLPAGERSAGSIIPAGEETTGPGR